MAQANARKAAQRRRAGENPTANGKPEVLGPAPSNLAAPDVELELPYVCEFEIEGVAAILFHAWSNEAVAEKAKAKKGSAAKKTDNVESYVYRNEKGEICIPGIYVYGCMSDKKAGAARYRQDPRSPRKSAVDLFRAGISPATELASLGKGKKDWDYLDEQRAVVHGSAITRQRPAFNAGWRATFQFIVNMPEYIAPRFFLDVLTIGGRAVGVGDFRPTYGRFQVVRFEVLDL
jgi:hypothetical protein